MNRKIIEICTSIVCLYGLFYIADLAFKLVDKGWNYVWVYPTMAIIMFPIVIIMLGTLASALSSNTIFPKTNEGG
ncbi:hypothetical protein LCGC14_0569610 [marine sediment metagenome]|uniref:Uncharacterized protein n=1 Tax=marine sediment metagenome TaxID=412755 RepID=A0A0F9RPJ5_9ZZZZ